MRASAKLINAIKGFEGFRSRAYRCPAGVWTVGYGHTKGVKAGTVVTEHQAEVLLREDLAQFERAVNALGVACTQGQFDALVDFAYNCGTANLLSSTLLKRIKTGGTEAQIRYEFSRWNKAGGKVLPGLTKRRLWEANRYYEKD